MGMGGGAASERHLNAARTVNNPLIVGPGGPDAIPGAPADRCWIGAGLQAM
jgi:hypothetical protein